MTKAALIKEIHKLGWYTYEEIERLYSQARNKYPSRLKYYAVKAWKAKLYAILKTLQDQKK